MSVSLDGFPALFHDCRMVARVSMWSIKLHALIALMLRICLLHTLARM